MSVSQQRIFVEMKNDVLTPLVPDHCLEAIRINLMCTGDIGIFTFREYPEYGYEDGDFWPDFSTLHTCRNFDAIHKWAIDNTVSWTHDV